MQLPSPTLGRNGLIPASKKREGDGCTPRGNYRLREIWYRADRVPRLSSGLPQRIITAQDCWCDAPDHPLYNRHFTLPLEDGSDAPRSYECLWREDGAYDVIVVIGYNDAPVLPGRGSAIFLHCTHEDGRATAGCIALPKAHLIAMLPLLGEESHIHIGKKIVVA